MKNIKLRIITYRKRQKRDSSMLKIKDSSDNLIHQNYLLNYNKTLKYVNYNLIFIELDSKFQYEPDPSKIYHNLKNHISLTVSFLS